MVGKHLASLVLILFVWLFASSFTLSGCGPSGGVARPTGPASTGSPAEADCGTFDLRQGQSLPDTALRCFIDAVAAGHPAQLKQTRPTVEGDPITVTYHADTQGNVEVVTDSTKDRFGTQAVVRQTCTGPTASAGQLTFAHCSDPTRVNAPAL